MKKNFTLLFGIVLLCLSCKKSSCENAVKATFHDATGLDGCGMVIKLENGNAIEPRNLNEFDIVPKDGDKIWVSYHLVQNAGSICMIGDIVDIDCIQKR